MDIIILVFGYEYDNILIFNFYKPESFLNMSLTIQEFAEKFVTEKMMEKVKISLLFHQQNDNN